MSGERTDWLFVYGTLRRGAASPLADTMRRHARWVAAASVPGRLYRVSWYPGWVPGDDGSRVHGDLFEILTPASLIPLLDAFEECGPPHLPPHEYVRERVLARRADGAEQSAWAYRYQRPVGGLERIGSGDFLAGSG